MAGVDLALVLGKPLGVVGVSWLMVRAQAGAGCRPACRGAELS